MVPQGKNNVVWISKRRSVFRVIYIYEISFSNVAITLTYRQLCAVWCCTMLPEGQLCSTSVLSAWKTVMTT